MLLKDKVALVTGAASGMGRATAQLFAREGARVAVTGRHRERGEQVVDEIRDAGGDAAFIPADLSVEEDVRQMADRTVERFGRITTLVRESASLTGQKKEDISGEPGAFDWASR